MIRQCRKGALYHCWSNYYTVTLSGTTSKNSYTQAVKNLKYFKCIVILELWNETTKCIPWTYTTTLAYNVATENYQKSSLTINRAISNFTNFNSYKDYLTKESLNKLTNLNSHDLKLYSHLLNNIQNK